MGTRSKGFENYVSKYNTPRKSGVLISYVIGKILKRPYAATMALLPQTEQYYCNLTLDDRNRRYIEYLKRVYSLLGELMLGIDGYEWLGELAMSNRNGPQSFGNLSTHYDEPCHGT